MADEKLTSEVVLHRIAGATCQAIAMLHDISVPMVRYYLKRARKAGLVTSAEIRHKPRKKPARRMADAEYDARWVERTKRFVTITDGGCWVWTKNKTYNGYGETNYRCKTKRVHRVMYEIANNVRLPPTVEVCHSCDNKPCCNPDHLWAGTKKQNAVDLVAKRKHHEQKVTQCPQGHAYDDENTYILHKKNGGTSRHCRQCQRDKGKRLWRDQRERMIQRQRNYKARKLQEQASG